MISQVRLILGTTTNSLNKIQSDLDNEDNHTKTESLQNCVYYHTHHAKWK